MQGVLYNTPNTCEFCGKNHKDNCDFEFNDDRLNLKDLVRRIRDNRDLKLVVHWK